jgi:hypothetical protein
MRCLLGVLASALFASCAHVYDDGFAGDGGAVRDQDSQVEEGGERSTGEPIGHDDPARGDGARERNAGRPSGGGDSSMVVEGPGQPGAALDAGPAPAPVLDAAVIQLFEPITVQSEVSSEHATPNDDIVILWRTFDPSKSYEPQRAEIEGDLTRFRVVLPDEPPVEGRYPLEDPETGVSYEGAVEIAAGAIYRVVDGKMESNPEGVTALDVDTVIGQTKAWLVWTPVDLPAGWQHGARAGVIESDAPLSAGYHLFIDGVEVDIGTLITMYNDIWT